MMYWSRVIVWSSQLTSRHWPWSCRGRTVVIAVTTRGEEAATDARRATIYRRSGAWRRNDTRRQQTDTRHVATGQLMVEHATEDNTARHLRSQVTASLVYLFVCFFYHAKYCDGYILACPLAYLGNHTGELRQVCVHAACGHGSVLLQICYASMSEQFFTYFITRQS